MISITNRIVWGVFRALTAISLALSWAVSIPAQPAQAAAGFSEYFIPGPASQIQPILVNNDNDPVVGNNITNVITVVLSSNNTTVYYDHWEDGYGTGAVGNNEMYVGNKGTVFTFRSDVPYTHGAVLTGDCAGSTFPGGGSPGGAANRCYDGKDRIYVAGGGVSVSQVFWPTAAALGTVYANAWDIYPTKPYQTSYVIPVGENLNDVSYLDNFGAVAYNNSNGTINWSSNPWVETNDDGLPGSGKILVTAATLAAWTTPGADSNSIISRPVPLTTSAYLTFGVTETGTHDNADIFYVEVVEQWRRLVDNVLEDIDPDEHRRDADDQHQPIRRAQYADPIRDHGIRCSGRRRVHDMSTMCRSTPTCWTSRTCTCWWSRGTTTRTL